MVIVMYLNAITTQQTTPDLSKSNFMINQKRNILIKSDLGEGLHNIVLYGEAQNI